MRQEVTTLILAGGQGKRLSPLTKDRSKPAVPIGGKFRLIDIPISNCLHAGIKQIWIITQFASESLHRHIFNSYKMEPYARGFVSLLAATQTFDNEGWYQGTADAVRKNIRYFHNAYDDMLVLSGDHLYRMDYRAFLNYHIQKKADVTLSVVPVTAQEVPEYGIIKTSPDFRVTDFSEKPKDKSIIESFTVPEEVRQHNVEHFEIGADKTHFASMGVYLFKKDKLFELLESTTHEDFGKQIIPEAIKNLSVYAYPFNGYWEDIGTIQKFFEAHIALTTKNPSFNFYDENYPIFTHARFLPAVKVNGATIESSIISEGSIINNSLITNSVIGLRSIIRSNCTIERVIMMGNDYYERYPVVEPSVSPPLGVGENAILTNAIIDKNVRVGRGAKLINKEGIVEGDRGPVIVKDGIIILPKGSTLPDGFEF